MCLQMKLYRKIIKVDSKQFKTINNCVCKHVVYLPMYKIMMRYSTNVRF